MTNIDIFTSSPSGPIFPLEILFDCNEPMDFQPENGGDPSEKRINPYANELNGRQHRLGVVRITATRRRCRHPLRPQRAGP